MPDITLDTAEVRSTGTRIQAAATTPLPQVAPLTAAEIGHPALARALADYAPQMQAGVDSLTTSMTMVGDWVIIAADGADQHVLLVRNGESGRGDGGELNRPSPAAAVAERRYRPNRGRAHRNRSGEFRRGCRRHRRDVPRRATIRQLVLARRCRVAFCPQRGTVLPTLLAADAANDPPGDRG